VSVLLPVGSLTAFALALGILVTYIVGTVVEGTSSLGSLVTFLCSFFLYSFDVFKLESPNWLVTSGHEEDARKSLQKLRGR